MSDHKVIGRLLCGVCDPSNRRVVARIVDTPDGPALRSKLRRPGGPVPDASPDTVRNDYDDVLLADMGSPWNQTHALSLGCPKHSWGAFMPEYLREMDAEYRRTGKPVTRVVDFSSSIPDR